MTSGLKRILSFVILIIGLISLARGYQDNQRHTRLTQTGVHTTANILKAEEQLGTKGAANRLHLTLFYHVDRDYTTETIVGEGRIPNDQYNALKTAPTVSIAYLPDDPGYAEVDGANWYNGSYVVGIAFTAIGLFASLSWLRRGSSA